MLTNERITEIKARLAARTPGTWFVFGHEVRCVDEELGDVIIAELFTKYRQHPEDADLIANAPADLADLIAALEAVTEERDRLRAERTPQ